MLQKKSENMYNKPVSIIISLICSFCLLSCNQTNTQQNVQQNYQIGTSVYLTDEYITIFDNNKQSSDTHDVQIRIGDTIDYTIGVFNNQKTTFIDLLTAHGVFNIAYLLAQNNGDIKMNLDVQNAKDTTIICHVDIADIQEYATKVQSGSCAQLIGICDAENMESQVIKYLYKMNLKNVSDEFKNKMLLYIQALNKTDDYSQYVTVQEIPVVTSFRGINYKISSDLVADNYYLFACESEKELDEFVEEMISLKFEGAAHSLTQPISCYRSPNSSGTICIFLIGIDNDWTWRIAPVGLICIDNSAPNSKDNTNILAFEYAFDSVMNHHDLLFKNNKIIVRMPENTPVIEGVVYLSTNDWSGNGISCNVNFQVFYRGDVKSITLVREENLAKWVGKGKKVIDLQEVSNPYLFSYELHLEDGDNYLPIIITDLRGNKTEFQYNVGCESKPNNTPQINIDNNVTVN